MIVEPLSSRQVKPAHKFLWAVKTYLDLISRDDPLVYGSGLKRLFVMASGVATFNETDIEALVAKADETRTIPQNLHGFMTMSIAKNIELYGKELQRIIQDRIIGISNGDVANPIPTAVYNADRARREFYVPPAPFILRMKKALDDDIGLRDLNFLPPVVTSIQDVANDGDLLLARMQMDEGYNSPTETAWGALANVVEGLVSVLERDALHGPVVDYRIRARGALKLLWIISKLLMGDLTVKPLSEDITLVDLDQRLNLSDGTLAAIPFPLRETVDLFSDEDSLGITMKGRFYLSAVAGAVFYRQPSE